MIELMLRWCILVPTAVALALLLPTIQPWRRCERVADAHEVGDGEAGAWMVPLALGLVYTLTHLGLRENWRLSIPPTDVKLYLVYSMPVVVPMTDAKSHTVGEENPSTDYATANVLAVAHTTKRPPISRSQAKAVTSVAI